VSAQDPDGETAEPPLFVPELIRDLERTLGVGVIVQSIEDGPTVLIRATLILGPHADQVTGAGPDEDAAWRDLARAAVAWRSSSDKQVPYWWAGG
jgi:hypothetical protein